MKKEEKTHQDNWKDQASFCCKTCMYYVAKSDNIGRCRYYPPKPVQGFVVMFPTDFCGQHKLRTF